MYDTADLPSLLTDPEFSNLEPNYTIPSNIDPSTISYASESLSAPLASCVVSKLCATVESPDNGESIILNSHKFGSVAGDQKWMTVETVLIRLDTTLVDHGRFPVYLNKTLPSDSATWRVVGYDAAVCVRRYESWIVETYNTSIASPSTLQLVGKGNASTPLSPSGRIQGSPIVNTRHLNTTGKNPILYTAHDNTIKQMQKDISQDGYYTLPPTVGLVVLPRIAFLLTST